MDSFHNVRLSKRIETGVSGGPGFKTSIIETSSGDEYRNVEWSRVRGRWTIAYTNDHRDNQEITAFFYARRGRAYGFRFRDWSDYHVDNVFAVGDGTTTEFQAAKVYEPGPYAFWRPLTRLVAPVVISIDGVSNGDAVVDINTGKVNFPLAPDAGAQISIKCQFDVPVRFDIDDLPVLMVTQDLSQIQGVPIIEIRDRGES